MLLSFVFIVVFGTLWHFRRVKGGWTGVLSCPDCQEPRVFIEKEAFKAFSIYWFPVVRVEDGGRLVECGTCEGKFDCPAEIAPGFAGDSQGAIGLF